MKNLYWVFKGPIFTEKSNLLESKYKKITLEVAINSSKRQIKEALKKLFNLDAISVNTAIVRGKNKRIKKHWGKESNWKKAIILLKKHENANIFGFSMRN
ncbi:MAG: 50S ribosomal protein L23 [Deltaproteobacteria bacterium]|nr:MAG: 50S ribosomal protein L23 [Deltaproteobacteria bacterium]